MEINKNIHLWFYPKFYKKEKITKKELQISEKLSLNRKEEYIYTRGYLRKSLSKLLDLDPLEIPIDALPGEIPKLENNLGFISISHCKDAILIGWSKDNLGVDIERKVRKINHNLLKDYVFNDCQIPTIKQEVSEKNLYLLGWSAKESAIKWQKGKILRDITNWVIEKDFNYMRNNITGTKLKISYIIHKNWVITCVF